MPAGVSVDDFNLILNSSRIYEGKYGLYMTPTVVAVKGKDDVMSDPSEIPTKRKQDNLSVSRASPKIPPTSHHHPP